MRTAKTPPFFHWFVLPAVGLGVVFLAAMVALFQYSFREYIPGSIAVGGFTLGNFAEGLSSSAGMKQAGRNLRYVVTVWVGIALVTSLTAILGYAIFADIGLERGWLEAIAAGALIALVVETMAPEAVHGQPRFSGLLAMLGFAALLVALAYGDATSAWL